MGTELIQVQFIASEWQNERIHPTQWCISRVLKIMNISVSFPCSSKGNQPDNSWETCPWLSRIMSDLSRVSRVTPLLHTFYTPSCPLRRSPLHSHHAALSQVVCCSIIPACVAALSQWVLYWSALVCFLLSFVDYVLSKDCHSLYSRVLRNAWA